MFSSLIIQILSAQYMSNHSISCEKMVSKFDFRILISFLNFLLDMFGIIEPLSAEKGILALPVGVYEISLAAWLIVKGFNEQKLNELRGRN